MNTTFRKGVPCSTYSILAYDKAEGVMGIGVQSHFFSVGSAVPWVEAGTGAVATQAMVNIQFGPDGLECLGEGSDAEETLAYLLAGDEGRESRQAAVCDTAGNIAAHTGKNCIPEADHLIRGSYSVQANMMLRNTVCGKMAAAFERAEGILAEKILISLFTAENEGGDIRGRQSAAIKIVRIEKSGRVNQDNVLCLRVEDHPAPLTEMQRLLSLHRAYRLLDEGDNALEKGEKDRAFSVYRKALSLAPENLEMKYWYAVSLANFGEIEKAAVLFGEVYAEDENWRELTRRLPEARLLKVSEKEIDKILG